MRIRTTLELSRSTTAPMRWAIIQIPSMAIDGPSMPIGKSCDGHRWAIDGPSMDHRWPIDGLRWAHRWD